jgi:predicted dehydrogenase
MRPELKATDSFVAELSEVVRCVRGGQTSSILGGDLAVDALVLCEKQTQSVRTGKLVKL